MLRTERIKLNCHLCNKEFLIPRWQIHISKYHYCSLSCVGKSRWVGRKIYPKILGKCQYCGKDIIAKNASFNKPNRKFCSVSCRASSGNRKRTITEKRRKELSDSCRKRFTGYKRSLSSRIKGSNSIKGEKHWNWQGGKTKEAFAERSNLKLKYWRKLVFQRDNYTCQVCGSRNGNGKAIMLNAHHIKRWSDYPELRYKVSNGITYCEDCHKLTDNYKGKKVK